MPGIRQMNAVLLAAIFAVACDIPTELPKWDTTFVVKAETVTLSAAQILPSSVTVSGNAFALSLSPSTFSQTLGQMCPACAPFNGLVVPKPAFTATFGSSIALPADVAAASLTSGSVTLRVQNGLSFDPLRPNGATAPFGTITATARSGTAVLGTTVIDGANTALPPGGSVQVTVPLNAATVTSALDVSITLNSPAGGTAQINTSNQVTVTATPSNLLISSVQVRVQNRQVIATPVALNLGDIDTFVTDHLQGGSLILNINNPFAVTGTLTLTITGGSTPITKQVSIAANQSTVEVPFTATELKSILGHDNVTLSISGPVSAVGNVTVTPQQVITFSAQLKLIIGAKD